MLFRRLIFLLIILITGQSLLSGDDQRAQFIFSQLEYPGNWDPHPDAFEQIYYYMANTTSIKVDPQRRVVKAGDELLFYSPFILFTGRGRYPEFTETDISNLRRYLNGGGIMLIDTCSDPEFEASADRTIERVFPGNSYKKIGDDHAVFRSFYLINYVSGLSIRTPYLEGITVSSRIAVIKSRNDLLGIWPRDRLGNWKNSIVSGRYGQRKEAIKLTLNLLIYSVCGTYKNDPVHQPHIDKKLGR
ncbi:MAG: DUF4159 domain-containing protein [Elusimicrobiota bacterium]